MASIPEKATSALRELVEICNRYGIEISGSFALHDSEFPDGPRTVWNLAVIDEDGVEDRYGRRLPLWNGKSRRDGK